MELEPVNDNEVLSSSESSSSSDDGDDNASHFHEDRPPLPVTLHKERILNVIRENQVMIISGPTGCGKTTKLPQYMLEIGLGKHGIIGITQPRRMAAISIAKRISKEMKCALGREVGYQIRFDTKLNSSTKIKIMTEGILLNEIQSDKRLHDYSVIIADEVHERSINSDILLGLLKLVAAKRKDLKIIICSATISLEKFSRYFPGSTTYTIDGTVYPIEIVFSKHKIKEKYTVEESVKLVKRIHGEQKGDILIFFPGEDEIISCLEKVESLKLKNVILFPLYAAIGIDAQNKVFKPTPEGFIKIVMATNIAETSITIDGIKFVIDSGYVKESGYNTHFDLQTLDNVPVSKAQANQRSGRAGRTSPGTCYRLYREKDFKQFADEPIPEILRENLYEMYLKLVVLSFKPHEFEYLDIPSEEKLTHARDELVYLSLLDSNGKLTLMGKEVSDFPIAPRLGKLIYTSVEKKSFYDILCISAMLTERFIFKRPWKNRRNVEQMQDTFNDSDGDHFTMLKLYKEWKQQDNQRRWCQTYFVSIHVMKEVDLIVEQLILILMRKNFVVTSEFNGNKAEIKKAFLSVFLKNVCFIREGQKGKNATKLLDEQYFGILPGSSFAKIGPHDVGLFCQAFRIKARYCNQTMGLEPHIMDGFEEELKLIGFKQKMENPDSVL